MKIFRRATDLQRYLSDLRTNNRSVGFVPTMGALHQGHLSLVERSRAENQVTVVSIFVNPTQFNNATDLKKYPRTPGKDIELLTTVGCEVVFLPTVEQVYPEDGSYQPAPIDFGQLDKVMEGAMRPGHFAGVANVVQRLLELTLPDRLYMGQKDYQQAAIVRAMLNKRGIDVELIVGKTVREPDGLAMSSRNIRLLEQHRKMAPELHQILQDVKNSILAGEAPDQVTARASDLLDAIPGFRVEYVAIFDGHTLQPISNIHQAKIVVTALAVWAGDVRLIDNIIISE